MRKGHGKTLRGGAKMPKKKGKNMRNFFTRKIVEKSKPKPEKNIMNLLSSSFGEMGVKEAPKAKVTVEIENIRKKNVRNVIANVRRKYVRSDRPEQALQRLQLVLHSVEDESKKAGGQRAATYLAAMLPDLRRAVEEIDGELRDIDIEGEYIDFYRASESVEANLDNFYRLLHEIREKVGDHREEIQDAIVSLCNDILSAMTKHLGLLQKDDMDELVSLLEGARI